MRKSISQMEHHHKLEKEEFISKIVKLNNIIEVLEK